MSEFRDDLLVTSIDKKRVIKIFILAGILLGAFLFSTFLFSLIGESQRPDPNNEYGNAIPVDDVQKIDFPFPYNMSDFQMQFPNLTLDQLTELLNMFDGDIEDLDLNDFSQALAALMFSEVEVFRVRNYDESIFDMEKKLWRYESFDEYNGTAWRSRSASAPATFYDLSDYWTYHSDKDLLTIQMPLSVNPDYNSMVIPGLFPDPNIISGSIFSNPGFIDYITNPPNIFKDGYNCTVLDVNFNMEGDLNMSYDMFGLNLPTAAQIAAVAIEPSYTPDTLKDFYLTLRGDTVQNYINNWDDFAYHYNVLNGLISSSDSAYEVADKIRSYLHYNFNKITDPSQYNPAPDGYDQIEWFLEQRIGYWPDFTSAFCAFARAFGLATRFVDGFNSIGIQDMGNIFAIKYKNLYNWAEVYIPTSPSDGFWIQMDVYYDVPPTSANYVLTLNSNFTAGYRGGVANITGILTLDGNPVEGEPINFVDENTLQYLGEAYTNADGEASILIPIDDTQVVGSHFIYGEYAPNVNDTTYFEIYGDIEVNLISVNPQEVNITLDTSTNIQGYVIDPINNQRVRFSPLEFILLQKGTNIRVSTTPFDMNFGYSDMNGDFDYIVNVDNSVPIGQFELRVDLNATYANDSSNRLDFNVTQGLVKKLWFYINNYPNTVVDQPIANRFSSLTLKAKVVNETNYPLAGELVSFYDYDRGVFIGSNLTDTTGITTYTYTLGNFNTIGPNLLYAKLGGIQNYSYFILNEEPVINIFSGPIPREINRTATGATNTFFTIQGEIVDPTNNNPIRNSMLSLKLLRAGSDYSTFLIPSSDFYTNYDGFFIANFQVASNTPTGNYSIRLDFNGTMNGWYPYYTSFSLDFINTSSNFINQLKVSTPTVLVFNFWIDGIPSSDYNNPVVYPNQVLNLGVYLESGGIPIGDGEWIDFYDVTQELFIGSVQTLGGFANIAYNIGSSAVAGPHQIYAKWLSNYNYSYFIVDSPISISLSSGPSPQEIYRSGTFQRTFNLVGTVIDFTLGSPIKYSYINVYLFDGAIDVSYYLILQSGSRRLDETAVFDLTYSVSSSTPDKNYTIFIEFAGIFMYSSPYNFNNQHDFYLGGFTNFSNIVSGYDELKVIDPDNLDINLFVELNPTLPLYNDTNPPETYNFGDTAHIQVQIIHAIPKTGNTVYLYDDFTNSLITSYTFVDESGFVQFNISTNTLHAGLIRIRANYATYSTFNTTYIVINETLSISINLDRYVIQRQFHQFDVWGLLQQNGVNLDGLVIGLFLFNDTPSDVTADYLNIMGSQYQLISGGNYQYMDNTIFLNCPQGQYYIVIYFTGTIIETGISLNNYMITTSSFLPINVTAGTIMIGNFDTKVVKDDFYEGDDLYVYGYLTWDNGTAMNNMLVNVTIKNSLGETIATGFGTTDINGFF
ncbi:MAG: transglutaminase-like domain-containing protein, partial [Candidatus Hermodarchaeota archaeon]